MFRVIYRLLVARPQTCVVYVSILQSSIVYTFFAKPTESCKAFIPGWVDNIKTGLRIYKICVVSQVVFGDSSCWNHKPLHFKLSLSPPPVNWSKKFCFPRWLHHLRNTCINCPGLLHVKWFQTTIQSAYILYSYL